MPRYFLFISIFIFACQTETTDSTDFTEVDFQEPSLYLTAEDHDQIGQPALINHIDSGLLVYDYLAQSIFLFDEEGNQKYRFGREGDGPGEFRYIAGLWKSGDQYIAYDRNSSKVIYYDLNGSLLSEAPLRLESLALSMSLYTQDQIYAPTNGFEGSLISRVNLQEGSSEHFGQSLINKDEDFDFDKSQQEILSGRVPPNMINRLLLESNESGLFSYQQATAILQKYSHDKELLWEVDLSVPATEGIFDRFIEINQSFVDRGMRNMYMLQYASQMSAAQNGAFILINTIPDHPTTVVWVSNEGDKVVSAYLRNQEDFNPDLLAVSNSGEHVFLGSRMEAMILKLNWPN